MSGKRIGQPNAGQCRLGPHSLVLATVFSILVFAGSSTVRGERMPDFALMDTNSTSSTHGQLVSPRDYLGQVTGWYFGHAT